MPDKLAPELIKNCVAVLKLALQEDAVRNDITSQVFINPHQNATAILIAKQNGLWCGDALVIAAQKIMGRKIHIQSLIADGTAIKPGQTLLTLSGNLRAILGLERSLLNLLQNLCGISSLTQQFTKQARKTKILDTRKTTPGLRMLQRYAVRVGGGVNHRFNLSSAFLIKENHLAELATPIATLLKKARKYKKPIVIEAESLEQVAEFLSLEVDRILLDNFSISQLKQALKLRKKFNSKIPFEVSGGITLKTIKGYALPGIDFISVGAFTHSAPALDLSLRITPV